MATSPRRDFLKLALGGALAAASAALTSARASAATLGAAESLRARQRARPRARTRQVALQGAQIDAARRLLRPQFRAIFRHPAHGGLVGVERRKVRLRARTAAPRLHFHDAGATRTSSRTVRQRRLIYDRADYDFGKLRPPADLPDLGFSGVRVLKTTAGQGWQDLAIFQGATFFRSLARGQTYGVNARGLSIRTGDAQGEEFPLFRELWIEKPSPASDALTIHALLDSASLTGAFHFTLRPGDATIIDTELTLVARVEVDHLGLGAMTATYFFGAARPSPRRRRAPRRLRRRGIADPHRRRRMVVAPDRQPRHPADFRLRRHEPARLRPSSALARLRRLRRRRRPLGTSPLAVDRADRRLGRRRGDSARDPFRFGKQRQRHRAMAAQGGPRRRARRSRSPIASSGAGRRPRARPWRR